MYAVDKYISKTIFSNTYAVFWTDVFQKQLSNDPNLKFRTTCNNAIVYRAKDLNTCYAIFRLVQFNKTFSLSLHLYLISFYVDLQFVKIPIKIP